ncbi:MAG: hypothetical protein WA477_06590 [Candidatus Sulfotelmatobacter sp.]
MAFNAREVTDEPLSHKFAINNLRTDPIALQSLCGLEGRATSSEWVKYDVPLICRHLNAPAGNYGFEFINVPASFELSVSRWRSIFPKICEVQPEWIEKFAVTAVVLYVLTAVAALWNRQSNSVEGRGDALRKIEQSVVGRIELPASWEGSLHRDRNPVPKVHASRFQMRGQMECPLGQVIDKNRPARFQHPNALINPTEAPFQVVDAFQVVLIFAVTIVLPQIERRIGEDSINPLVRNCREQLHAINMV